MNVSSFLFVLATSSLDCCDLASNAEKHLDFFSIPRHLPIF